MEITESGVLVTVPRVQLFCLIFFFFLKLKTLLHTKVVFYFLFFFSKVFSLYQTHQKEFPSKSLMDVVLMNPTNNFKSKDRGRVLKTKSYRPHLKSSNVKIARWIH